VFSSWLLLVRGELRRTGRRGVSLRATGAWDLPALHAVWQRARTTAEALDRVHAELARVPEPIGSGAGDVAGRRVLVHSSGFRLSPYADVAPAGDPARGVARKLGALDPRVSEATDPPSRTLWHRSPGSPG
jgi:error-prone DNA polymerase